MASANPLGFCAHQRIQTTQGTSQAFIRALDSFLVLARDGIEVSQCPHSEGPRSRVARLSTQLDQLKAVLSALAGPAPGQTVDGQTMNCLRGKPDVTEFRADLEHPLTYSFQGLKPVAPRLTPARLDPHQAEVGVGDGFLVLYFLAQSQGALQQHFALFIACGEDVGVAGFKQKNAIGVSCRPTPQREGDIVPRGR